MKKLTLIFAAFLALGSLTAKAQMRSGVDTLTLDQVKYRITYDAQQQFYLNAIGLEDLKGKETLKYAKPEKTEKVSQSDLTKIKLRDDGSEMLRDEKWTDENGKPIKPKARKRVFNPIER